MTSIKLKLVKPVIAAIKLTNLDMMLAARDYVIQEKSDGCHEYLDLGGIIFNTERMRSGAFTHIVNDVVGTTDTSAGRLRYLSDTFSTSQHLAAARGFRLRLSQVFRSADEVRGYIASGGEGAVLKPVDGAFGIGWLKAKRVQNWICRVVALNISTGAASVVDAETVEDRGTVPMLNNVFAARVGSILKVCGMELTAAGKIREPRLDNDAPGSWLVTF